MTVTATTGVEKHIVTVMISIITVLLIWIGWTTQQTAVGVAKLQVQIEGISVNKERLDRFEERLLKIEAGE